MKFEQKVKIVAEAFLVLKSTLRRQSADLATLKIISDLLDYADLGFPLAALIEYGYIPAKGLDSATKAIVDDTYSVLMATYEVDLNSNYPDFKAVLDYNYEAHK